jgi:hypothetical protein
LGNALQLGLRQLAGAGNVAFDNIFGHDGLLINDRSSKMPALKNAAGWAAVV